LVISEKNRSTIEYIHTDWNQGKKHCIDDLFSIFDTFKTISSSGSWLDIGTGPMGVLWSQINNVKGEYVCCDIQDNLSKFYSSFKNRSDVSTFINTYFSKIKLSYCGVRPKYTMWNALDYNPHWECRFDNVIQVGCFGCLQTIDDLKKAILHTHHYLKRNGLFYSWTWIPNENHIESDQWGGNGIRTITPDEIEAIAMRCGYSIINKHITKNPSKMYKARVGYVFQSNDIINS
jgi:hypothetical protein